MPIDSHLSTPPDYHLLGFTCNKLLFFDTVLTFGLHPATLACQRTTSAIQFMHQQMGYVSTNYIDDFGGCDTPDQADDALHALQFLFDLFGIESSPEKNCPPATLMTFLSLLFNTVTMTHSIPDNKISDLWHSSSRSCKCQAYLVIASSPSLV